MEKLIGLSEQEAAARLKRDGYNEIAKEKKKKTFQILFEVLKEPMFALLLACGLIYSVLGSVEEAIMLFVSVFFIFGLTIVQERKTERALEALRDLSSPRALVIRNGEKKRIAGREVVRGDIILIAEGDRIPADAVMISNKNLLVDESILTGESMPVDKSEGDEQTERVVPGGSGLPFVFSGSLAVSGRGVARVTAIGENTEMGKIGKALASVHQERTNLEKENRKMVRIFATIGISLCVLIVIIYGLEHSDWLTGFLAGLTMAMGTLPEELPVVMTVFLALGAWRMSQHKVLARRMQAIEMLGAANVLCVDKTGTLTMNQMQVQAIADIDRIYVIDARSNDLPEEAHSIIEFAVLASPADPFDPMEKAMKNLGERCIKNTEHWHSNWSFVKEYPFNNSLLALTRVWQEGGSQSCQVAVKGAPEAIIDLCHLDPQTAKKVEGQVERLSESGFRVIGVGKAECLPAELTENAHDFKFDFVGLLGLSDPVRPGAKEAVAECHKAGIKVVMITGDYPGTAKNIASQVGLDGNDLMTGAELDRLGEDELRDKVSNIEIFARIVPEQKLKIVQALKSRGLIVAMTGDGVNDAPALKAAHIGIAMGGRGTDVAREASDLVLLDDNFLSIVKAVRMGRRIYTNLQKAITYIMAVHIPIAGMSFLPVLFDWPLALLPAHILFLELLIDPACSIVFEMEKPESDIMQYPPRSIKKPLFSREIAWLSIMQGTALLAILLGIYYVALQRGESDGEARMLAFASMIVGNIIIIFANRSWGRSIIKNIRIGNPALWWVVGGASVFLGLVLIAPFFQRLFQFGTFQLNELKYLAITIILMMIVTEIARRIVGRHASTSLEMENKE